MGAAATRSSSTWSPDHSFVVRDRRDRRQPAATADRRPDRTDVTRGAPMTDQRPRRPPDLPAAPFLQGRGAGRRRGVPRRLHRARRPARPPRRPRPPHPRRAVGRAASVGRRAVAADAEGRDRPAQVRELARLHRPRRQAAGDAGSTAAGLVPDARGLQEEVRRRRRLRGEDRRQRRRSSRRSSRPSSAACRPAGTSWS